MKTKTTKSKKKMKQVGEPHSYTEVYSKWVSTGKSYTHHISRKPNWVNRHLYKATGKWGEDFATELKLSLTTVLGRYRAYGVDALHPKFQGKQTRLLAKAVREGDITSEPPQSPHALSFYSPLDMKRIANPQTQEDYALAIAYYTQRRDALNKKIDALQYLADELEESIAV